jgi:hypothetical protein
VSGSLPVLGQSTLEATDEPNSLLSETLLPSPATLITLDAAEYTIAVDSFNFHEEFFGQNFNIDKGAWIRTGCVGFWSGMARLRLSLSVWSN